MAGTKAGGLKAAKKNLARDPNFYAKIGALLFFRSVDEVYISFKSSELSPLHCRLSKNLREEFLSNLLPLYLICILKMMIRAKSRLVMRQRKPVPRTYILADITTKHPILKFIFKCGGNFIFQLYGKEGNALTPIDNLIRHDGSRRARIDALSSRATVIGSRVVGLEIQVANNLRKHKKRSSLLGDEQRVLPYPSEP